MVQLLGLLTLLLTLVLPANLSSGSRLQTQQLRSKCPSLRIVAPDGKEMLEDTWRFTALLEGGDPKTEVSFMWSVYKGKIISGQSTTSITIDKPDLQKGVTVVVEVGSFPTECVNKATVTIIS